MAARSHPFALAFSLAVALTVAGAAGPTTGARAAARGHSAPKSAPRSPAPATFECADALDDGTLVDERQVEVLARLAAGAHWLVGEPPRGDLRPRGVRLFCGPDLDGDGDREAEVELHYDNPGSDDDAMSSDSAGVVYSMLVSKHGPTWRAVAGVAVDLGGGPEAGRGATFVHRPGGHWGVEARRSSGGSEHDCRIAGYEIFELHANVLRSVKTGDRSVTCLPCGCDQP